MWIEKIKLAGYNGTGTVDILHSQYKDQSVQ